jgi:hypothetical protein
VALPLARLAPGAAVAVGVLIGARFVTEWLPMILSALVTVGAGGAAYVLVARLTGVAESDAVLAPLRRLRR